MKYTSHKISFTRGRSPGLSQERMQEPITHVSLITQSTPSN